MAYLLGVDGGGSRTTAWLAQNSRRILARAVAGPSNPLKVGRQAAQRELLRAARLAMAGGHMKRSALDVVVVGLAGVERPSVRRPMLAWLRRALPARVHLLTSDAAIALRAAFGNSPGIVVISGSGSIAYGRDWGGRVWRAGGWGNLYDDVGSGYDLGRKAIAATLQAFDGRGLRTKLESKICHAFHLPDITHVVERPLATQQIAALFPLVLQAARRGDDVARRLCEEAGRDLSNLVVALLQRLGRQGRVLPVVGAGGVFRTSHRIRESFVHHLRRHAPGLSVSFLSRSPVEGALAMARELAAKL